MIVIRRYGQIKDQKQQKESGWFEIYEKIDRKIKGIYTFDFFVIHAMSRLKRCKLKTTNAILKTLKEIKKGLLFL